MNYELCIVIGALVAGCLWLVHHQRRLKVRAHLMEEAIRNRDFTFRLPVNGLLPGERAMQETLNQLGGTIRQQVSQNEVESWERLTRVLTHEIMNAIAPIASISQAMLTRQDVQGTPLEEGIHAIHTASCHLSGFVDSYRKLSQLQEPRIETICLAPMVRDIGGLYPAVALEMDIPADAAVSADGSMLRQILINLIKNGVEAGATHFAVAFDAEAHTLSVSNDGQPIPADARQSIFVPFFTTKRTGSGIGLSVSRRMMIQQGGSLTLAEQPLTGYHTTFLMEFEGGR